MKPLESAKLAIAKKETRWIIADGCPPSEAAAFQELFSDFPLWALLEEANSSDSRFRMAQHPSKWFLIDALHENDPGTVLRGIKTFLNYLPEKKFCFLTSGSLRAMELPSYLGKGVYLPFDGANGESKNDSMLLAYSRKLTPKYELKDLVLGPKGMLKFTEALSYISTKGFVENEWGFLKRHSRGHGVTLVFNGESGTGKTMAAEVVASHLKLPIYQVDLSSLVSKWVGETERNLKAIFRAAEGVKGILLFDEGDALFGTRTKVEGSQDKYSNLEVNFLLQEIEAFNGIVILSTNHEKNMDPAFLRRFTYSITFGRPIESQRASIWRQNLPKELPLGKTVDLERLGLFGLTGGNIKNCIRDAAARAAGKTVKVVEQEDFLWAIKRELQKHGIELDRGLVGEDYWKKVAPEWEFQFFKSSPRVPA